MNYREAMLRTCGQRSSINQMLNAAMGLAGESGEFCDLVKKYVFHEKPMDRAAAIKELGDIRWYLELASHCLGVTMEEVENKNIEKLKLRYPNGFTSHDAITRKDECGAV
jgi:NTP pyrophosphatase (non-canonical NTP hydrolase)